MTKFKKILIGFGVLGFLFLAYVAYANYRWNTEGASMFVPREKAIGVITNQYGIRDSDLEFINELKVSNKDKKLLLSTAKIYQEMIVNSNNKDWIRKNHDLLRFKNFCMSEFFESAPWYKNYWDKLGDNDEREIFEAEFSQNSAQLGLIITLPQKDQYLKCFDE